MDDRTEAGEQSGATEPPMFEEGRWLAERRTLMDGGEAAWLDVLAAFDRDDGWAVDGQLSCAAWLMWRCGMARSTAYEKLRLAHELSRRDVLHDAFAAGEISYSATRAIASIDWPSREVDEALVELARSAPITDVEAAVRYYQCLQDQELGRPFRAPERRDVRIWRGHHGLGQLRATLTNDELASIEALLRAFTARPDQSAAADSQPSGGGLSSVDGSEGSSAGGTAESEGPAEPDFGVPGEDPGQSAAADSQAGGPEAEDWRVTHGRTRADALMDAVAVALAHPAEGHTPGADRYMVHLVAPLGVAGAHGPVEMANGDPLPPDAAARIACDASFVAHLLGARGEPLYLGRRVRDWSIGQRRAVMVRDRGRCRFPGCERMITDIHHVVPWEEGGNTDVANGALLCTRHHTLVHQGYGCQGDANGELRFQRPDGSFLGYSAPPAPRMSLFQAAA